VLGSATPDEGELAELSVSSSIWALRTYRLRDCQFVHGRHTHEDHTWFPRLRVINPAPPSTGSRPSTRPSPCARHNRAARTTPPETDEAARTSLAAALRELAEHLLQHLDWEEDAVFPTIRRMRAWRQTGA
jgi:hypothetical protein